MHRGELPDVDDDVAADRYVLADGLLTGAGLEWYEVSNWAKPGGECRHNLGYWRGGDWWGVGPGAHSHVGGVRWWNVRHPSAYAERITAGHSPAQAREVLTAAERGMEDVMLRTRLREGIPLRSLSPNGREVARSARTDGFLDATSYEKGRLVLTRTGRLVADAIIRSLVD